MKWTTIVVMALTLLVVGCGMDKNDPAYAYQNSRWINEQTGLELQMNNGRGHWISHSTGDKDDLTYTADKSGNLTIHSGTDRIFKKDLILQNRGKSLFSDALMTSWVPMDETIEKRVNEEAEKHKAIAAVRDAKRPASPDGYERIDADGLLAVGASRMKGPMQEENLASVFIDGYSASMDAFAKRDLLAAKMPELKARLAKLAKQNDYQMPFAGDKDMIGVLPAFPENTSPMYGGLTSEEYDFNSKSFPLTGSFLPCKSSGAPGASEIAYRGLKFSVEPWGISSIPECQWKVADEALARRIEAARKNYNLAFAGTVYFRVTGEKTADGALVLDVHRVVTQPYERVKQGFGRDKSVYEPLGGPYTFNSPKEKSEE